MTSTWVLRCVIAAALAIVAAAVVVPATIYRGKEIAGISTAGDKTPAASPATDPAAGPAVTTGPVITGLDGRLAPGAATLDDDTGDVYRTPLAQGVGALLAAGETVVPEVGEQGIAGQLHRADELLYQSRLQNRNAIREANRQVRLRRNSPDLVLITVNGLDCSQLVSFAGAGAEPAIDGIAATSLRQKISSPGNALSARQSLTTGRQPKQNLQTDASLPATLFDSGYDTAVIGDCSFWNVVAGGDLRVTRWTGFRTSKEAAQPYPEVVWSNGVAMKLVANAGGKRGYAVHQLFTSEAFAFLNEPRKRPKAIVLSYPAGSTAQHRDEVLNAIAKISDALAKTARGRSTVLMIIGLPDSGGGGKLAEAEPPASFPLIVNWPSRFQVPADAGIQPMVHYEDILPTLVEALSAARRPRVLAGRSLMGDWKAAAAQ